MFENPALVGLPTHGRHIMLKSTDGGQHWTKPVEIFQITDPCFFIDPVYCRCVMDGFAGARTDLAATPSVDIANGAPTGLNAPNTIVDAWGDATPGLNNEKTMVSFSVNGGKDWATPAPVSLPGDRPLYAAPAISPDGSHVYVVYEAVTSPWLGADMTTARPYHGVFLTAPVAGGVPGTWSVIENGALGDLRGTYPGHDLYQERVGDYVYAEVSSTYGISVWTDARNAQGCSAIQAYRAASLAAGDLALPAPWPLDPTVNCPNFGNTDTWASTTG
jgi:hypothetical protein